MKPCIHSKRRSSIRWSERLAFTSYSIADLLRFLWFITVSEHLSFAVPPPSHCRKSLTPFCPALNTCRSIWSSLLVRWDVSSCGAFCEESIIFLKRFTNVCKTSRKIYKFVIWLNQENFYILNCPMKSKGVTAQMKALNEYFVMVVRCSCLLQNRVHVFANSTFNLDSRLLAALLFLLRSCTEHRSASHMGNGKRRDSARSLIGQRNVAVKWSRIPIIFRVVIH